MGRRELERKRSSKVKLNERNLLFITKFQELAIGQIERARFCVTFYFRTLSRSERKPLHGSGPEYEVMSFAVLMIYI